MKYLRHIAICFLILVLIMPGCREVHKPSDIELTSYAWEQYEDGNYQESYIWFREAVVTDSSYQDGYNGLGWAFGKLMQMDSSQIFFNMALGLEQPTDIVAKIRHEVWAGLAFSYQTVGMDSLAILFGDSLLNEISDPVNYPTASWTFSHDSNLNQLDVRLTLAVANFNLARFDETIDHISSLMLAVSDTTTNFSPDISTSAGRQQISAKLEELYYLVASN